MGTYTMWRTAADRGDLRRLTWIHGDQPVLTREVVRTVAAHVAAHELDTVHHNLMSVHPQVIWNELHQFPLTGGRRLIVVDDAQRITSWTPLVEWIQHAKTMPHTWAVFIAAPETAGEPPAAVIEALKTKRTLGHVVRCTMPNERDAIAWVRRRGPAFDDTAARHLLTRVGGDLAAAASVIDKCALFPGTPVPAVIDHLAEPEPGESFVDYLLARDKPAALLAAKAVNDTEVLAVIGQLDHRLDTLAALWQALRAGKRLHEVSGVPAWLARKYAPHAKHYDPQRCAYSRRVLSVLDSAVRNGARTGAMEALVALW